MEFSAGVEVHTAGNKIRRAPNWNNKYVQSDAFVQDLTVSGKLFRVIDDTVVI